MDQNEKDAKIFDWLKQMSKSLQILQNGQEKIIHRMTSISQRMDSMDQRMDLFDDRMENFEKGLQALLKSMQALRKEQITDRTHHKKEIRDIKEQLRVLQH